MDLEVKHDFETVPIRTSLIPLLCICYTKMKISIGEKMTHIYLLGFSFVLIVSPVFAKQWQSNFQQGVMEYFVDEGNGNRNRILLSCPDGRPSEISVTINGK